MGESWVTMLMMTDLCVPSGDDDVMSESGYPASRPRYRQPERASSRAMLPLRRLDTLREAPVDGDAELPPQVDFVDERWGGRSRPGSSYSDSRVPPRRRGSDQEQDHVEDGSQNPLLRRPPWNHPQP